MSHDGSAPRQFPRREFLKVASVTTLGIAMQPSVLRAMPIANPESGVDPLLSIGYAEGLPKSGDEIGLRSASAVLSGDPSFISRGARVTFTSFARAEQYRNRPSSGIAIDVVYDALSYTQERLPRFRAWSFSGRDSGDSASGPIGFKVPVTATGGLRLVLRSMTPDVRETAANAPRGLASEHETAATFEIGSDAGSLKLQRGAYVIAFREAAADSIGTWRPFRLVDDNGAPVLTPAPFSYVIMTIDYAS